MTLDRPGADELLFLPLGGSGEIGMNLTLYGHAGKWLMIDLGITFADGSAPGVDVILPDPAFIAERRADLAGIVLTHAHEDHIGAVPYLWPQLRCPLYATPFTAGLLRRKLAEAGLEGEAPLVEVPMSGRFRVGPFDVELVTITHSIPEPNCIVVRTPLGAVLHTGDWKIDPEPLVGEVTDEAALRRIGQDGVLAMVCDSTNALLDGWSRSEGAVRESLTELIGRFRKRVAVTCFASNVARLETIARAAMAHGRHTVLVGRSLWRIDQVARENGYLADLPAFLGEGDAGYLPEDKVLLLCTGCQGEPGSALAKIARGEHPQVALGPGDAVIFSSRVIPGNERAVGAVQNDLVRLGVEVVTEAEHFVHASGHPRRDELAAMYSWVRPRIAVPVHGELRHLRSHARFAESCQVPQAVVVENGAVLRLAPGPAAIIGEVPSGRLAVDGTSLVPLDGAALRSRRRIMFNGAAVATLVLDRAGRLQADPQVTLQGLIDPENGDDMIDDIREAVRGALATLSHAQRLDDAQVKEAARLALRRAFFARRGKKPVTDIHLVRI
ncbi:MAG: ribonuclease J [Rhodospirillaceae bacterium]|nr:ribonuclease J [Rhodospirillaceae bacterium]